MMGEYDAGYRDGSINYELEHFPACKNVADLQEVLEENAKLREQMERLVTLLRVDCDIDASWDGLRRFWSIGLTEDGCLMRDRACKAEAENAKLRDGANAMRQLYEDELKHALADNAKLQELCATVIDDWMSKVCPSFPFCEFGGEYQDCTDETCGNQIYRQMARELGVDE